MRVIHGSREYDGSPCVLAMGMFDGMHIGHRALIAAAAEEARRLGLSLAVLTYDKHPAEVLRPESAPPRLMTNEEKLAAMEACGVDVLLMLPFTRELAAVAPEDFLRTLCGRLHPAVLAAGYNHTFGARGSGNAALLTRMQEELGYRALILPGVTSGGDTVSSTRIRELLAQGRSEEADRLLGREQ